jgi:hypothetical protein
MGVGRARPRCIPSHDTTYSYNNTNRKGITHLKVFSTNALAELFELDRQTVVRALRGVPADGKERGQPRWRMKTAVTAIERHRANNDGGTGSSGTDPGLSAVFAAYDAEYAKMAALPTLEKRRAAAVKLAPLLADMDRKAREVGIANGQDAELVHLRADQMAKLALRGFEGPTQWTFAECHQHLDAA